MNVTDFQADPGDVEAHFCRVNEMKATAQCKEPPRKLPKAKLDLPRPDKGEHFIKGPIPLNWIQLATTCGGRGTEVGLLLWYAAGWQKRNPVKLTATICKQLGVHPKTTKRVLIRMEEVGLIKAKFHRGRSPVVTLLRLEASAEPDE
ncbi:MAG TPA: hypothetical protein DDZ51_25010 [Planctomycetaceae bacterium]|nr:hypothetical protein [Planctomycetaceae bacterium]